MSWRAAIRMQSSAPEKMVTHVVVTMHTSVDDGVSQQLGQRSLITSDKAPMSSHTPPQVSCNDAEGPRDGNNVVPKSELQDQLEVDKKAIYDHPLFPLLSLIFEKCELATQSMDCSSVDTFSNNVHAFVQKQQQDKKPLLSESEEANELMIKAIQVLRIHLLELEKVQELCKDFCNRYIACLRSNMQSENLLRTDYGGYDSDDSSVLAISSSRSSSVGAHMVAGHCVQQPSMESHSGPMSMCQITSPTSAPPTNPAGLQLNLDQHQQEQEMMLQPQTFPNHQLIHAQYPSGMSGGGLPSGGSSYFAEVNGANPLSTNFLLPPDANIDQIAASILRDEFDDDSDMEESKKAPGKAAGATTGLPKHATAVMKAWLFQHLMHPYPSEEEKQEICHQTNLSLQQVNNWFINARRRILQPINPHDKAGKAKSRSGFKSKPVAAAAVAAAAAAPERWSPHSMASMQGFPNNGSSLEMSHSPADHRHQTSNSTDENSD